MILNNIENILGNKVQAPDKKKASTDKQEDLKRSFAPMDDRLQVDIKIEGHVRLKMDKNNFKFLCTLLCLKSRSQEKVNLSLFAFENVRNHQICIYTYYVQARIQDFSKGGKILSI